MVGGKSNRGGLSKRPYHEVERNLLLVCSLFPGREWKQFFRVKNRKAAVWKHKHNKAYFNYTSESYLLTQTCEIKEGIEIKGIKTGLSTHLLQ